MKEFYPTPKPLIDRLYAKIKNRPKHILEPSAGRGDILDYLQALDRSYQKVFYAIESDITLQATLAGKGYSGWELNYGAAEDIRDIELVMSYFDGKSNFVSLADSLKAAFAIGENTAESEYFTAKAYQKGTLHITFKDLDIVRRFNLAAAKGKKWLPQDYGTVPYGELDTEMQKVVQSFETEKSYTKNAGRSVFAAPKTNLLLQGA